MLYIYLGVQNIKVLHLKKSLLGQYETSFAQKNLQVNLLEKGKPANPDIIASGLKEILATLPGAPIKEKDVTLILPQDSFTFMRSDLPVDISQSVLSSYIQEKARTELKLDTKNAFSDYLIRESENKKQVLFYAVAKDVVDSFTQPFSLLELKVSAIIPESVTYFKLFEKTLRQNKKENIWYVSYNQDRLSGYLYDSYGLLEPELWTTALTKKDKVEDVLQKKASTYTNKTIKLNRLILSGALADSVRQDTFTKNVGVWTNPLKRITTHFYADYIKLLGSDETKPLPLTDYDMLVGAFIFTTEEKSFSLMKGSNSVKSMMPSMPSSLPVKKIPVKSIAFFLISFGVTFAILFGLSQVKWNSLAFTMPTLSKPTPTPENTPTPVPPSPTPTPAFAKTDIKVKVLNGSGIAGKASVGKEFMRDQGYEEVLTGNADAFDYETTVIQLKEDAPKGLKELIAKDIATQVEKPVFETLDADDAADVVIIMGTDFK